MRYPSTFPVFSAASALIVAPALGHLAGAPLRRATVGTPVAHGLVPAREVHPVLVRVAVTASLLTHLPVPLAGL